MNRRLSVTALVLATLVTVGLGQAAYAQDGEYKIRVVDRERVFNEYNRQKTEFAELQKEVDRLQKPIDELSAQIEDLRADYDKRKDSMTEDDKAEMKGKVEVLVLQYQTKLKTNQNDIDRKNDKLMRSLLDDIDKGIKEVAIEENCHLVLNADEKSSVIVLFYSPTLDITQKVIDHLNAK